MLETTDTAIDSESIQRAWHALFHRIAVAGGSAMVLISLFANTRVHVACLRGFIAFAAVRILAGAGLWALKRALPSKEAGAEPDPQ